LTDKKTDKKPDKKPDKKAGRKRFIAGATCPQCGVEDRVYVLTQANAQSRHCNDCGFSEDLDALADKPVVEETSVASWQPIKLIDP